MRLIRLLVPLAFLPRANHVQITAAITKKRSVSFALMLFCQNTYSDNLKNILDLPLYQLATLKVSTVSRVSEDRDRAPGNVHVITQEMIKERGYRSLKDVLQVIPGFTVFHRDLQFVAGIRGLNANDNEKVTLLINGVESNGVNEPEFLNGPINLDNLERVEVIVGPSSFFQQANTLAATINIITKKTDETELIVSTGNDQPYSVTAITGKKWDGNRRVTASVTVEEKDGFNAWDDNNRPALEDNNDTGRLDTSVFAVIDGELDNYSGQLIAFHTQSGELSLNEFVGNDCIKYEQMFLANLKHSYDFSSTVKLKSFLNAGYKVSDRRCRNFPATGGLQQRVKQNDFSGEFALEHIGFKNHFIQTGLQLAYEDNYDSYYIVNDPEKITLLSQSSYALGVYASDTWQYSDKLKLIAGLRVDKNTIIGHDFYWGGRAAAAYDVTDNWVTKLMVNRTNRMPSPLAGLNEAWGKGNPNAPVWAALSDNASKPETLSTIEWQNIIYHEDTRLSITAYYQELSNFISWFQPHTNVGDFSGYGVEVDINHQFNSDLSLWFNSSFVEATLQTFAEGKTFSAGLPAGIIGATAIDDDDHILGSAKLTANVGVDYAFNDNIQFSTQLRYFTGQSAYRNQQGDFKPIRNRFYLDTALTYKNIIKGFDLRLSGQNILNNRSQVATQWRLDRYKPRGATFLFTLSAKF